MSAKEDQQDQAVKNQILSLRREWYSRLRAEGFHDIEVLAPDGNLYDIMRHALRIDPTTQESEERAEYYRRAIEFGHKYKFKSKVDATVWRMHAEGISYREMEEKVGLSDSSITLIIRRLRRQFKKFVLQEAARFITLNVHGEIENQDD